MPSVWHPKQEMPLRTVGSLAAGFETMFIGASFQTEAGSIDQDSILATRWED